MLDSKAEEEARDARKGSEVPSKQVRRVCVNEGDRTPSIGVAGVYVLTNKLLLTIYYKLNWKACIDLLVASLWNKQGA